MPILPKKSNTPENKSTLDDRTPVPRGDYLAHVVKTEYKATKAKNGHYLAVQHKILEGEHTGRVIFTNLNLDNPSTVAMEIANKEANSISVACQLEGVENSDEWLQIPHMISVTVSQGDPQYPPQNEISKYAALEAPVAVAVATTEPIPEDAVKADVAPVAAEVVATEKKLPWE